MHSGYISNMADIVQNTFKDIHVYVNGDAHVRDVYGVQQMNDIDFDNYMEKVVLKNQDREIFGSKYFKGDVIVEEDFYSPIVNSAPFERLFTHAMTIDGDQEILGKHTVKNMIASESISQFLCSISIRNTICVGLDGFRKNNPSYEFCTAAYSLP